MPLHQGDTAAGSLYERQFFVVLHDKRQYQAHRICPPEEETVHTENQQSGYQFAATPYDFSDNLNDG